MTAVTEQPPRDDELRRFLPWLDERTQPAPAPVQLEPAAPPVAAAEDRRAKAAALAADKLRRRAAQLRITARRWTFAVIVISAVVTLFGSGNSHQVYLHHDTANPWAWLPYPALEAALIVEIQVGAALAEHKVPVVFWGAALRVVTAVAAITVCVYGPAESGDWGGAGLHAIGPVVQFFLAEFLARAREKFRLATEALLDKADGRENTVRGSADREVEPAAKRTKKSSSASRPRTDGRTKPADEPAAAAADPSVQVDEKDLLVRAHAAADELARTDQRLNRDNLVRAIRAGGGTIQNKDGGRLLAQIRAERGGPDLQPVREKGA